LETGNIQLNAPTVHAGGLSINNSASCSLKTSNLKYHLMRDLLQKKSLEEIMQLKDRLIQNK